MKNDRTIEFLLHMKVRNWSRPPSPPSQCWKLKCWQKHKFDHQHRIQHWSEGGRGSKSPQNDHIFSFFVLHEVRKCVELFSPNWRGQSLRSPIRFLSADRCTKSICCNVEWRMKKCKKMTNMKCYPTLSTHQNNIKHHKKRAHCCIQRFAAFGGSENLRRMGELRDWPLQSVRFWGK